MKQETPTHLPLPVCRNIDLTEPAYERLRPLNERYGLGNNYLLAVLLENLDTMADPGRTHRVFRGFITETGGPVGERE